MEIQSRAALLLLLLGLVAPAMVSCNIEGDILYAQRTAWTDPSNVLQSWDPTLVNPCTWFHVTCNSDNFVIRVDLGNADISGPLVPELGGLTKLQYLELYENKISGAIPPSIGNLTNLVSLDLYKNLITGAIPSVIGNLKSLRYLRLFGNNITGAIPSLENLINLGSLDLHHNSISGSIPSTLGKLMSLKYLRLDGNMLSGTLPIEVLNLVNIGSLEFLNVSNNSLQGTQRSSKHRVAMIIQDMSTRTPPSEET